MKLQRSIARWAARPYDETRDTLHRDIFCSAIMLLEEGHDKDTTFAAMRRAADFVEEREVPDRELFSAIDCAESYLKGGIRLEGVRWPTPEPLYLGEIVHANLAVATELIEVARARASCSAMEMLRLIYLPSALLCVGFEAQVFATGTMEQVEQWHTIRPVEFITPSPMSKLEGTTKEGRISPHCEDNTGPKRYQVIEFDKGEPAHHVCCHLHLARQIPLMMLVYSGGKSVHGWFRVQEDSDLRSFFYDACLLGADQVMWSKSQFTRMPEGINKKTTRIQKVMYFDRKYTLHS